MEEFKIGDKVEFKSEDIKNTYSHFSEIKNFTVLDFIYTDRFTNGLEKGKIQIVNLDGFSVESKYLKKVNNDNGYQLVYAIKCNDKFVYYYLDDYLYGEVSLHNLDIGYADMFHLERKYAEYNLDYIVENWYNIVGNELIGKLDDLKFDIVKIKIKFEELLEEC